jgi:hypothetical protein
MTAMTAGADRLARGCDRRPFADRGPGPKLRGELPDPGTAPTARELEVAAAVCRHGFQKEAAHELGITLRTVKNHLAALSHKLGTNGAFTQTLMALGWLAVPEDRLIVLQARSGVIEGLRRQLVALRDDIDAEVSRLDRVLA